MEVTVVVAAGVMEAGVVVEVEEAGVVAEEGVDVVDHVVAVEEAGQVGVAASEEEEAVDHMTGKG